MPIENIFIVIPMLLLAAKICGEIAERLNVASLVGEIIGGIIVGPVLGFVAINSFINDFFTLSVIFLLFMAGLEIKFEDIKHHTYTAAMLAVSGGVLSFIFGFVVGMFFFNDVIVALAIGVVLVTTSNGTLFLFLMKTGEFNSKIGRLIIAITISDDIVGILFISFFSAFVKSHTIAFGSILFLFLVSIGFYLVMFTAGAKIANAILNFVSRFRDENILFSISLALAFLLAYVTDNIGLSIAAGAFLAGMAIANSHYSHSVISPKVMIAAMGFFVPIFYAGVGTVLILKDLNIALIIGIMGAAVFGKMIGIGFLSRFFGVRGNNQRLMGIIMMPRGNENIAIVQIVFLLGVITYQIYTSIIFAMVATVILTPILLRLFWKK